MGDDDGMSEKLKPCPFRVHGERTASLTVDGEYYYNEIFMPCMRDACACYEEVGDKIICFRENSSFVLAERREE